MKAPRWIRRELRREMREKLAARALGEAAAGPCRSWGVWNTHGQIKKLMLETVSRAMRPVVSRRLSLCEVGPVTLAHGVLGCDEVPGRVYSVPVPDGIAGTNGKLANLIRIAAPGIETIEQRARMKAATVYRQHMVEMRRRAQAEELGVTRRKQRPKGVYAAEKAARRAAAAERRAKRSPEASSKYRAKLEEALRRRELGLPKGKWSPEAIARVRAGRWAGQAAAKGRAVADPGEAFRFLLGPLDTAPLIPVVSGASGSTDGDAAPRARERKG